MANEDGVLNIDRFIDASPSRVWKAWSTPEQLAQWWIPAPIECQVVALDLRPGGGFVTLMREGDGPFTPHLDACFLEIVPEARLVFTTALRKGWHPVDPWMTITAIITMDAEGAGTRYASRVLHKTAEDARKHEELGFHEGWGTVIDQLATLVCSSG